MADDDIDVEVIYALPTEQALLRLRVANGATVAEAIRLSGVMSRYSEINLQTTRVGIFGNIAALDTPLKAGDRVEIYRPLTIDPKEARRRRLILKKRI